MGEKAWKAFSPIDGSVILPAREVSEERAKEILEEADRRAFLIMARDSALDAFLDLYEESGVYGTWAELRSKAERAGPASPVTSRTADYLQAVLDLRGLEFPNAARYFEEIADRSPKPDGDTPEGRAVRLQFQRNGMVKVGEGLEDFRGRLELEAAQVWSPHSGDGHPGSVLPSSLTRLF